MSSNDKNFIFKKFRIMIVLYFFIFILQSISFLFMHQFNFLSSCLILLSGYAFLIDKRLSDKYAQLNINKKILLYTPYLSVVLMNVLFDLFYLNNSYNMFLLVIIKYLVYSLLIIFLLLYKSYRDLIGIAGIANIYFFLTLEFKNISIITSSNLYLYFLIILFYTITTLAIIRYLSNLRFKQHNFSLMKFYNRSLITSGLLVVVVARSYSYGFDSNDGNFLNSPYLKIGNYLSIYYYNIALLLLSIIVVGILFLKKDRLFKTGFLLVLSLVCSLNYIVYFKLSQIKVEKDYINTLGIDYEERDEVFYLSYSNNKSMYFQNYYISGNNEKLTNYFMDNGQYHNLNNIVNNSISLNSYSSYYKNEIQSNVAFNKQNILAINNIVFENNYDTYITMQRFDTESSVGFGIVKDMTLDENRIAHNGEDKIINKAINKEELAQAMEDVSKLNVKNANYYIDITFVGKYGSMISYTIEYSSGVAYFDKLIKEVNRND